MRKIQRLQFQSLDLKTDVIKEVLKRGYEVAGLAFLKLFPGEIMLVENLSTGYESVRDHTEPVYTIRYKGKVLCRRYPADLLGLKYRFESPIFETEKQ